MPAATDLDSPEFWMTKTGKDQGMEHPEHNPGEPSFGEHAEDAPHNPGEQTFGGEPTPAEQVDDSASSGSTGDESRA